MLQKQNALAKRNFHVGWSRGLAMAGAALLFSTSASATSFTCSAKLSASEHIICIDPQLSALDDQLARAYNRAKFSAIDPRPIEADRTHQWLWRQRNCTDKSCVVAWYKRRIAELQADYAQNGLARDEAFETDLSAQDLSPSTKMAMRRIRTEAGDVSIPVAK